MAPLAKAARAGRRDVVEALLAAGAGVMKGIEPPWGQAFHAGDPEIVRLFLEAGADPNERFEDDVTPLACAVMTNAEIVGLLLTAGARLDVHDRSGHSPFTYLFAMHEHRRPDVEIVALLRDRAPAEDVERVRSSCPESLLGAYGL